MNKLSYQDIDLLAQTCAEAIKNQFPNHKTIGVEHIKAYAIPRGGVPAALAVQQYVPALVLVDTPEEADICIDDVIDSGKTADYYAEFHDLQTFALIDKRQPDADQSWIVFPWEEDAKGSFEDNIVRLLQFVGEDASRGGLAETPARVVKAWQHWCSGYGKDPAAVLKVFEDGAENYDQMVMVKDIPIYSHCEHHMAPIFGTATIAYIPNGKIVGLSKLSRLADMFARRLQVQERLTSQIADALDEHLQPKGAGVIIKARHMCMESRGTCQQGHHTITSALRGCFREGQARDEFMDLAK